MKIAIIPARGGSKRIPRKNIKEFLGKPMIAWTIDAALQSQCFDRVVVSTDDAEIAQVAASYGAEVPFRRPDELANDYTGTRDVVRHAILELFDDPGATDFVCCLYAASPFIQASDVHHAFRLLDESNALFSFSVTSFPYPIQRALEISAENRVSMLHPEHIKSRSQDLVEAFHDAGQFYWGRTSAFLGEVSMFSTHSIPYVLPRYRVQDIDTLEDWHRAEVMFSTLAKMNHLR